LLFGNTGHRKPAGDGWPVSTALTRVAAWSQYLQSWYGRQLWEQTKEDRMVDESRGLVIDLGGPVSRRCQDRTARVSGDGVSGRGMTSV